MSPDTESDLGSSLTYQHPGLGRPGGPGLAAYLGAELLAMIEDRVLPRGVTVHTGVDVVPDPEIVIQEHPLVPGGNQTILSLTD